MSKLYKNNTSGYPGVFFDKHTSKYKTFLNLNGKKIRLGSYSSLFLAVKARGELLYLKQDFISSALFSHNPKIDYPTAKLLFFKIAQDYYNDALGSKTKPLKSYFLDYIQNLNASIPNAKSKLLALFDSLIPQNAKILDDWAKGSNLDDLAKLYSSSKSQINRKIIAIINEIDFNDFL